MSDDTILETLKKASTAIYIACDEKTADHISITFRRAVRRIEFLETLCATEKLATDVLIERISTLEAELAELKRGEFICKKCGLRKDGESAPHDF